MIRFIKAYQSGKPKQHPIWMSSHQGGSFRMVFPAAGAIPGRGHIETSGGPLDIVLTPAELAGQTHKIAWYKAPDDPRREWTEHVVIPKIEAVIHALALGDFNRDGRY
jgi:hypothetical protein